MQVLQLEQISTVRTTAESTLIANQIILIIHVSELSCGCVD